MPKVLHAASTAGLAFCRNMLSFMNEPSNMMGVYDTCTSFRMGARELFSKLSKCSGCRMDTDSIEMYIGHKKKRDSKANIYPAMFQLGVRGKKIQLLIV